MAKNQPRPPLSPVQPLRLDGCGERSPGSALDLPPGLITGGMSIKDICERYGNRALLKAPAGVRDTAAAREDRWLTFALDARRRYRRSIGLA